MTSNKEEVEEPPKQLNEDQVYKLFSERFETTKRMVSMAMKLNEETQASFKPFQDRFYKYAGLYEELYRTSPGLFYAALNGTLLLGQTGEVVKSFIDGRGDMKETWIKMQSYQMKEQKEIEQKLQKYFDEAEKKPL